MNKRQKYALVNPEGEVVTVVSPGFDLWENYSSQGENIVVCVDEDAYTDTELTETLVWDFQAQSWKPRETRPGKHYKWKNGRWNADNPAALAELRKQRQIKLASTDWTQLADCPLSTYEKEAWTIYRQKLREVPRTFANIRDLDEVVWPKKPGED